MSMSTHVVGFREPDDLWRKHKAVWDACIEAGVDPPESTIDFFGGEEPDERGIEVDLRRSEFGWSNTFSSGYEIPVSEIPANVTHIRFYNSW